jgi:hypothetical protein
MSTNMKTSHSLYTTTSQEAIQRERTFISHWIGITTRNWVEQTLSLSKAYTPLVGFVLTVLTTLILTVVHGFKGLYFTYFVLFFSYFLFKNTLNTVQAVGRVYLIVRDYVPANTPLIATGFMKEINPPWRHGKGIQVRAFKYTLQIGLCKRQQLTDETGVLAAIQGRFTDDTPSEIGNW